MGMKFGVCIPNYGETCDVESIREVAKAAEELNYDSIWATDHVLMPKNSNTPYERVFECVTTLAFVCSFTQRVKIGISSLVFAMRNPVLTAKQLATIDVLSGGRLILATGAGWNQKEFEHLGADFKNRGRILDENLALLRALWNSQPFEGSRFSLKDYSFEPKPVQAHLPIWIAGNSVSAMKRAVKLGDAWHPNAYPMEVFESLISKFKALGSTKPICVRIAYDLNAKQTVYTSAQGERRVLLCSDFDKNREVIQRLQQMGVSQLVIAPNPTGRTPLKTQLESLRLFSKHLIE